MTWLTQAFDLEDLAGNTIALQEMADQLAALGYAQDAARETEELLVLLRQWSIRAEVRIARLTDVWRAAGKLSGPTDTDSRMAAALAAYRADTTATPPP